MVEFPTQAEIIALGECLAARLADSYAAVRPLPRNTAEIPDIPATGQGIEAVDALWGRIVDDSAHLGTPWMSGHMDTAPHPVAAMTQALVAALNNNLLFRELSPLASKVEEQLVDFFGRTLGLDNDWNGTWASGGSVANLTALFAAVGGYENHDRSAFHLVIPESGHASLKKAAAILGIAPDQLHTVACDHAGRLDPEALSSQLKALPKGAKPIVVSVLGNTIHGSVDDVDTISDIAANFGAWHHVDAIYGAALAFSTSHKHFLRGIHRVDSIVLGPQKWMYVPRVSAIVLIRGKRLFDERLGFGVPYSVSEEAHRGYWGVQGSRPADALVLWALLQTIGTEAVGKLVDQTIELTRTFHDILLGSELVAPAHTPDLNLQVIRVLRDVDPLDLQRRLTEAGTTWLSVSRWRGETFLRAVLLSPSLTTAHLHKFKTSLEHAAR